MRIRVIDRLLILLAGLILLALTAALAAEAFLGWQVFGPVSEVLHRGDTVSLVIIAAAALALLALGLYCVGTLFRRDKAHIFEPPYIVDRQPPVLPSYGIAFHSGFVVTAQ